MKSQIGIKKMQLVCIYIYFQVLKEESEENSAKDLNEEENTTMKEKIISIRKKLFKATEEKVQLREASCHGAGSSVWIAIHTQWGC